MASAFADVEGFLGAETPIVGGMAWVRMRQLSSRLAVSTQRLVLTGTSPDPYTTLKASASAIASYRPRIPTPLRR